MKVKYNTDTEATSFTKTGFSGFDSSKNFLRVRKINKDVVITYKGPCEEDSKMDSREEIEIQVDDYSKAVMMMEKLGFEK